MNRSCRSPFPLPIRAVLAAVAAASWLHAGAPDFAVSAGTSVEPGRIVEIVPASGADLVIVKGGFQSGYRNGMAFAAVRGSAVIAELIAVDHTPRFSAMLITSIAADTPLQPGDRVTVQVRPPADPSR